MRLQKVLDQQVQVPDHQHWMMPRCCLPQICFFFLLSERTHHLHPLHQGPCYVLLQAQMAVVLDPPCVNLLYLVFQLVMENQKQWHHVLRVHSAGDHLFLGLVLVAPHPL
uniref:Uncharacterized protein n=1 Tax=Arundo donax TaxID=35708 RepID=A0A0A9E185_ARUDO